MTQLLQLQPDGQIVVNAGKGVGLLGEAIAAQWARAQGWELLHHRWHCRWGELDWVACEHPPQSSSQHLVFIEVKTRSARNWDSNGLMAITPQKQQKLWQTAELFLSTFPECAAFPCRFDLILVQHRRSPVQKGKPTPRRQHTQSSDSNSQTVPHYNSTVNSPKPSFLVVPSVQTQSFPSAWIALDHYQLRIEQHIQNVFEG